MIEQSLGVETINYDPGLNDMAIRISALMRARNDVQNTNLREDYIAIVTASLDAEMAEMAADFDQIFSNVSSEDEGVEVIVDG